MIEMKVRYELTDVNLKISNVTPREAEESYVLIRLADDNNNEVVFALSHNQAEHLEIELYEAHRRRVSSSSPHHVVKGFAQHDDHLAH
jgi:poly-gamma-glutamate capsule biosynthesis protein CapA/YwtB (metallophosphatase superfamily)